MFEANRLFTDETKIKIAMEYLVKNFWSIVAFGYNEKNLGESKKLRDELLEKIEKFDSNKSKDLVSLEPSEIESELVSFNQDAVLLKNKILKQNELLKSLIQAIEESKQETNENKTPTNSLPTQSSPETVNSQNQEYFCYPVNGYIAVDDNLELTNHINEQEVEENSPSQAKQENILFQCPKCHTSIDQSSISYDMYEIHVQECDTDKNLTCMFCYLLFDKSKVNEYTEHIEQHLTQLNHDLRNTNSEVD